MIPAGGRCVGPWRKVARTSRLLRRPTVATATIPTFRTDAFIDGAFRPAASGERFVTENPATGRPLAEIAAGDAADVDAAVKAARAAFEEHRLEHDPADRQRPHQRQQRDPAGAAER